MSGRILYGISPDWDSENPDGMKHSTFLIALYLRVRELSGKGKATKEDLYSLPLSERSVDGVLAKLNQRGLVIKEKVR